MKVRFNKQLYKKGLRKNAAALQKSGSLKRFKLWLSKQDGFEHFG